MKKLICIVLSILMLATAVAFVGCDKAPATLKMGLGVYTATPTTADATEDNDGQGKVAITAAVITVDAEGKVVACQLDTADLTVKFTADGKAVANNGFKTKYELGKDYNMVAYGGATKEWFEQADAFNALCVGKTATEIKALCASDNYGTDEVKTAGCTILVNGLTKAAAKIG